MKTFTAEDLKKARAVQAAIYKMYRETYAKARKMMRSPGFSVELLLLLEWYEQQAEAAKKSRKKEIRQLVGQLQEEAMYTAFVLVTGIEALDVRAANRLTERSTPRP